MTHEEPVSRGPAPRLTAVYGDGHRTAPTTGVLRRVPPARYLLAAPEPRDSLASQVTHPAQPEASGSPFIVGREGAQGRSYPL